MSLAFNRTILFINASICHFSAFGSICHVGIFHLNLPAGQYLSQPFIIVNDLSQGSEKSHMPKVGI